MRLGLDLDGTLISCKEKHCTLMLYLTKALNIRIDIEAYWDFKRNGKNNIGALKKLNIVEKNAVLLNKYWCQHIENMEWLYFDKVFPDTILTLEQFISNNHTLHLISARNNPANAMLQIKQLNLESYFESFNFVKSLKGENKKDIFQELALDLYIGDTEYDYNSSVESNIQCYIVTTGMRNERILSSLNARTYSNLNLIPQVLKKG